MSQENIDDYLILVEKPFAQNIKSMEESKSQFDIVSDIIANHRQKIFIINWHIKC